MARSRSGAFVRRGDGYPAWHHRFRRLAAAQRFPHSARAAAKPERIAPSIVAGRPVSIQSPASARLRQRVRVGGPLAFVAPASPRRWRGVPSRSASAAYRPHRGRRRGRRRATIAAPVRRRVFHEAVGGADGNGQNLALAEHPFRRAADQRRQTAANVSGATVRKCALRMARNSSGAAISGNSRDATEGGTERTTA